MTTLRVLRSGNNMSSDSFPVDAIEIHNPYQEKKRKMSESGRFAFSNGNSIAHADGDFQPSISAGEIIATVSASDLVVSASDKAGMEGIDRAAIDAIIMKESGNSLFMQQQRKRDEKVNEKIACLRQKLQLKLDHNETSWRRQTEDQVDADIPSWIAARPARSFKVVIDMDMFFMACELLTRPDITDNMPACVGGTNMICTSNYAARRYGVRAAMPGYIGQALVRQLSKGRKSLVFCKLNYALYQEKSLLVRQALSEFDPNLTAYSLDDVFLDVGPYLLQSMIHPGWTHSQIAKTLAPISNLSTSVDSDGTTKCHNTADLQFEREYPVTDDCCGDDESKLNCPQRLLDFSADQCLARATEIMSDMRQRVYLITGGLTCSAGLAPNFLLAKIASDRIKPNGQLAIPSDHESVTKFLHPLPVRKISGIGRVTEKTLKAFGIITVEQLHRERGLVSFLFDRRSSISSFLLRAAVGCSSSDGRECEDEPCHQKGISRERTIPSGKTWVELNAKIEDLARLISTDLEKKVLSALTVTVKVKLHTFDCLSRSRTLSRERCIQSTEDLVDVATELLREIRQKEKETNDRAIKNGEGCVARQLFSVRLLGIRCSNLLPDIECKARGNQMSITKFLVEKSTEQENFTAATKDRANDNALAKTILVEGVDVHPEGDIGSVDDRLGKKAMDLPICIRIACPLCAAVVQGADDEIVNEELNRHIDTCLNSTVVRQAVQEETVRSPTGRIKPRKRQLGRIQNFFPSKCPQRQTK